MGYLNSINSVLAGGELVDEQLDAVAGGGLFGKITKKLDPGENPHSSPEA